MARLKQKSAKVTTSQWKECDVNAVATGQRATGQPEGDWKDNVMKPLGLGPM